MYRAWVARMRHRSLCLDSTIRIVLFMPVNQLPFLTWPFFIDYPAAWISYKRKLTERSSKKRTSRKSQFNRTIRYGQKFRNTWRSKYLVVDRIFMNKSFPFVSRCSHMWLAHFEPCCFTQWLLPRHSAVARLSWCIDFLLWASTVLEFLFHYPCWCRQDEVFVCMRCS